jgi:hypothetical protein
VKHQHQGVLLFCRLERHEAHVRSAGCLADRFGITLVVFYALTAFAVRRGELRSDEVDLAPERAQLASPEVSSAACFHGHVAGLKVGKPLEKFLS